MTAVRSPSRPGARAQEADRPRLRVVPPAERGWGPLVLFCVIAFLVTMAAAVFVQGERIRSQERSDELTTLIDRAGEQARRLRVDVATAESPERILGAARAQGMVDPGPVAAVPAVPLEGPAGDG